VQFFTFIFYKVNISRTHEKDNYPYSFFVDYLDLNMYVQYAPKTCLTGAAAYFEYRSNENLININLNSGYLVKPNLQEG
jgi:hypothetical protein